jgi:hypothetical protein
MSNRDELRKQWAEYKKKTEAIEKIAPETRRMHTPSEGIVVYHIEDDEFEIACHDRDGNVTDSIYLTATQAEKLYRFLGGLYD